MRVEKEWLQQWEQKRQMLLCPSDLQGYFTKGKVAGKQMDVLPVGKVSVPTGSVIVADPLVYLGRESKPYFLEVPVGEFDTQIAVVCATADDCQRYAAARVLFTGEDAVVFQEALMGVENLNDLAEGEYFGFNVDAGMACICDSAVRDAYVDFESAFLKQHPGGNMYDDYFAALLEENYRAHPLYQREGGDWLNWKIPGTEYRVPIFQSGFGDGAYPVYFGYDKKGDICQLAVQFIDMTLAYGEKDRE